METSVADETPSSLPLERLRATYVEGDFLGCLAQLAELDVDAALAAGARAEVRRFHVLAAGCALGAGDEALATRYLARAHAADPPATRSRRRLRGFKRSTKGCRARRPTR
ncbi:MAG: hypothetical protein H6721_04385 [Sandaracinus sp.]|nr:hypothetical protein [Sandaracinus sp.]